MPLLFFPLTIFSVLFTYFFPLLFSSFFPQFLTFPTSLRINIAKTELDITLKQQSNDTHIHSHLYLSSSYTNAAHVQEPGIFWFTLM